MLYIEAITALEKAIKKDAIYCGVFFNRADIDEAIERMANKQAINPIILEKQIEDVHVTTKFKPEVCNIHAAMVGSPVIYNIIKYGERIPGQNISTNTGFLVNNVDYTNVNSFGFCDRIDAPESGIPHITISVGNGGAPVNTKDVDFNIPADGQITGIYSIIRKNNLKPLRSQKDIKEAYPNEYSEVLQSLQTFNNIRRKSNE